MVSSERTVEQDSIRSAVAERYSTIGTEPSAEKTIPAGRSWAERLGYPAALLDTVPPRALASFTGIGAPGLLAELSPGERVLDLGCGAGLDSILMAGQVTPHGHVYGVDLAPGMITAAQEALAEAHVNNVTVIQSAAEELPLQSGSIDVAVVNGLFNLVPDKAMVASELRRVIRMGGRLVGAEIVITDDRPPGKLDLEAWFQ